MAPVVPWNEVTVSEAWTRKARAGVRTRIDDRGVPELMAGRAEGW